MKQSLKRLLAVCLSATVALSAAETLRAEIRFGDCSDRFEAREMSKQGKFFSTADAYGVPWTSNGGRTLFGVTFNYPFKPIYAKVDCSGKIPLFDRAEIWWGGSVPARNSWSACILTTDGKLVKINPDTGKTIYPFDRTTLKFAPTTIKTLYVGLKGREDGFANFAAARKVLLYVLPDQNQTLTNGMFVSVPDFYQAAFSRSSPGLNGLSIINAFSMAGVAVFNSMTPFIEYKGSNLFAAKKEYPVKVGKSDNADTAEYTLTFNVPGEQPVDLAVKSIFRQSAEKSLEFSFRSGALPPGARIGYQFYGPASVFGAIADATPALSGTPIAMRTPAGSMKFYLGGADSLALARAKGRAFGTDWFGEVIESVKLETVASGPELEVAISLPIGSAGQPQPETLNYTWRPSLAGDGDEGIAPFKMSDLELLEEIDCGNTNDPHAFYDSTNDPAVEALKKKYGDKLVRCGGQANNYGFLAFLDNPKDGAVPLETIEGERCRAISDKMGSYFRYDLNTKLKPRTPYLVVVEHAFDKVRRGEFHSIILDEKTDDLIYSRGLYGGFEAEPGAGGGFKKEYTLCNFKGFYGKSVNYFGVKNKKNSLVFSNVVKSGDWIKAPGLAVKNIRLYLVKTMPALPDIASLAPAAGQQRSLTISTELDRGPDPWFLFQSPKLVGYNALWSHNSPSCGFFGGGWWGGPYGNFQPGSLAGNEMLFAAAQEQGLSINIHLGDLLHLGFEGSDYDSFTPSNGYNYECVPLKPTRAELAHIAGALRNVMPKLAKYRSLRDVSMQSWPATTLTRRNLEDFCADTGAKLTPSLAYPENIRSLLNGGPELLRQWQQWACAENFKFHQWLLAELRQYRPDLYITLSRYWNIGLITTFFRYDWINSGGEPGHTSIPDADRKKLATAGLKTYVDFIRFLGYDPGLYLNNPGFSFELETCGRLRDGQFGRDLPDYYATDWFRQIRDGFNKGGLGIMVSYTFLESSNPLIFYNCIFVAPKTAFRKELIEAVLFANPRNITVTAYNEPWGARLADFREFVVPYRLLPFTEPENYGGKLSDTAAQAVIKRYGGRHGLVNAGNKDTVVDLELPAGSTSVTDLSSGVPQKLATLRNKDGKQSVQIAMSAWSLKTLEIK